MDKVAEDEELITLRARWQALMELEIGSTEFEVATWMSRQEQLRLDIERSRYTDNDVKRT